MQKQLKISPKVITFFILASVVPWVTMAAFFSAYMYVADKEMTDFIKSHSDTMYANGYTASLIAFCLTYILAVQMINPKVKHILWRFVFYIVTNIVLFFLLCLLP